MTAFKNIQRAIARIGALAFLFIGLCATPMLAYQGDSTGVTTSGKTPITARDYSNESVEMADAMRADGKIYVVVATLAVLMTGIFIYMALLDRRLGKLEEDLRQQR